MDPIVLGRVENPEELDLEPLEVTLVGYTLEREEVAAMFRFRPIVPAGASLDVIRHTTADGDIPLRQALAYVDECLLEADRELFQEFLHRPDVMLEASVLTALYRQLTEFYSSRPTRRPSGSAPTGPPAKRTSRAAARSAASRSSKSRSS